MADPTFIIAGTITIDPDKRDRAVEVVATMAAATAEEEGNLGYDFSEDLTDPAVWYLWERWASQEALDAHFGSPHMAAFMGAWADCGLTFTSLARYDLSGVTQMM